MLVVKQARKTGWGVCVLESGLCVWVAIGQCRWQLDGKTAI